MSLTRNKRFGEISSCNRYRHWAEIKRYFVSTYDTKNDVAGPIFLKMTACHYLFKHIFPNISFYAIVQRRKTQLRCKR